MASSVSSVFAEELPQVTVTHGFNDSAFVGETYDVHQDVDRLCLLAQSVCCSLLVVNGHVALAFCVVLLESALVYPINRRG
jgi:hypothetical protein